MKILIANVGSTSYKYQLYDSATEEFLLSGYMERIGTDNSIVTHRGPQNITVQRILPLPKHTDAVQLSLSLIQDREVGAVQSLKEVGGIGFKTVHGGEISGAVLLDDKVLEVMEDYNLIVPAHNRPYIDAIRLFKETVPEIPLVGVFETWFHQSIPDYAYTYSIPAEWAEKYGIKKYGFHGASHRFISERVAEAYWPQGKPLRLVSCHLGGSSSLCAIKDGKSIDTSMGFSTQSGLPMSSRVGTIDPLVHFYILSKTKITHDELLHNFVTNSGLKGISGLSGDIRDLEEAAAKGNRRASLALKVFEYELKLYIGAYSAALNGVDVIAFTGGIGENASQLRGHVLSELSFLGIELDKECNKVTGQEIVISSENSKVKVIIIPANEAKIVGRETAKLLLEQAI